MDDISGLNNRVFQLLSQKSSKAAVDLLGMRLSTNFNGKFTEISLVEKKYSLPQVFGNFQIDEFCLMLSFLKKFLYFLNC